MFAFELSNDYSNNALVRWQRRLHHMNVLRPLWSLWRTSVAYPSRKEDTIDTSFMCSLLFTQTRCTQETSQTQYAVCDLVMVPNSTVDNNLPLERFMYVFVRYDSKLVRVVARNNKKECRCWVIVNAWGRSWYPSRKISEPRIKIRAFIITPIEI